MKVLIPCATLMYFFAFATTSGYFYGAILGLDPKQLDNLTICSLSLLNAFVLSVAVVRLATPKRRRTGCNRPAMAGLAPRLLAGVVQPTGRNRRPHSS